MKAVYARVSTDESAAKGYSIDNQIRECTQKAGTTNVLIYKDEGISGELLSRPGLDKMRSDMRKGIIEEVYCYDPDRLARNLMNQLLLDDEIRKQGIGLIFVNGEYANTPEGKMFFSFRGAIAEFEKSKIKERTSSGRVQKARKKKVVKDSKLYGYTYNDEKQTYVINESEAKVVKMIFDYYTNPDSPFKGINGIALHLTKLGIPTKKGAKQWHRQVVRQILMNQSYTGTYYQNRLNSEGIYVKRQSGQAAWETLRPKEEWIEMEIPSIISKDQFDYAQELLKQGRRRHAKESFHQYLLSGLVRCGKCGATMTGRRTLSHGKDYYIYTAKKNYAGHTTNCTKQMGENKLNTIVWDHLIELFNNPERLKEFSEDNQENNYIQDELDMIQSEIEKTKKGRKRLITLVSLSDEDMDLDEIKEQIRDLQQKENELTKQYNLLSEQIKASAESEPNEDLFNQAIDMYFNKKEVEFTFEEKQSIIRMVVKEVLVFDKDTVEIHLF